MKQIISLIVIILPILSSAQTSSIKPLTIGDETPNIMLTPLLNYPVSKYNLSQLKDKLVIFDFMTTGCVSCIEALPRFDSLQNKYGKRLQIILVTPEPQKSVELFLNRKNIEGLNLPVIASDTTLSQLFPHTYIPHEALIKNGKVLAVTYPEYIVDYNIQAILKGKDINFPIKRDISTFQYKQPLLELNDKIIPDFSYPITTGYSTVTSYMNNVPERFTTIRDTLKKIQRISMINVPIVDLYMRTLYGYGLAPAFIRLEVADTDGYRYKTSTGYYHEWLMKNTYCYEGLFPLNYSPSEIKKKIKNDLDFYLGLHGKMIKDTVACWVISKLSATLPVRKNNNLSELYNDPFKNASIDDILFYLNKDFGNTPAIDETNNGELKLQGLDRNQCSNIRLIKKKLKEYGLQITLTNRPVDMLVITEGKSK